ncbi:outer membrane beta-barrel protein [Undibacterium sp. TJN19]|uniref:outer membrane beta-barrel protein n=1 Tax=Undibacterium sp. TJN19 TaxID=3413055 RepID=UPI003BF14307
MLIKKISLIACAAAGILLSSFASAQVYVGGSVGKSDTNDRCNYAASCDAKATSFKVFGGYDIDKNFAVEAGYFASGTTSRSLNLVPGNSDQKKTGLSLAGLYKYEFSEAFTGFAKLGIAHLKTDSTYATSGLPPDSGSYSENQALYGVGLSYKFNNNLAVRTEFEKYNPKTFSNKGSAVSNFSVGVQYNF